MGRFFKRDDHGFEAVPAVVVADKTDKFGKRLGYFGLIMLVLFFAISSSVQAAKNGRLLERAAEDRSNLIVGMERITNTLDAQSDLIKQLRTAVNTQNKMLREAGLSPVDVGPPVPSPRPGPSPSPDIPRASSSPDPKPKPKPSPKPPPKPTPKPPPKPSPTPGPADPIKDLICQRTGVCT